MEPEQITWGVFFLGVFLLLIDLFFKQPPR